MNLAVLIFTFLMYGFFGALYNHEGDLATVFPTFSAPVLEFQEVPASCDGFTDCIEFVGNILVNMVLGVVYIVLLLYEIITLLVVLLALSAANAFTGLDGAPDWANGILLAIFGIAFTISIYKAVRKGDTDTE